MVLNILGKKWKVLFKGIVRDQGKTLGGTADDSKKTIEVCTSTIFENKKDHTEEVSRIFYHEFLHAVFKESDIRDQAWWSDDIEHFIIAPIARSLAHNLPLNHKKK